MSRIVAIATAVAIAAAAAGCRSKQTSRLSDGWHAHCNRLTADNRNWCRIPYFAAQALVAVYFHELRKNWYLKSEDLKAKMAAQLPDDTIFTVELADVTRVRVTIDCDTTVSSLVWGYCRGLYKISKTYTVDPAIGEIVENPSRYVPDYHRLKKKCETFFDDDPPVVKAWCNIDSYSVLILSAALSYNDTIVEKPWELRHYAVYMAGYDPVYPKVKLSPHSVSIVLQDMRCAGLEKNCFEGLPDGDTYSAGYIYQNIFPKTLVYDKFRSSSNRIDIRWQDQISDVLALDYRPVDIFYKPFAAAPSTPASSATENPASQPPVAPENSIRDGTGPKGTGSQDANGAKGKPGE